MYLAGKLSKFDVVDWNGRTSDHLRWWDMFVENITIELLEDICHQVLDLYSQIQKPSPTESPPLSQSIGHHNSTTQYHGPPHSHQQHVGSPPIAQIAGWYFFKY